MSNPLEIIQPSLRYLREQRELETVMVVETPKGADGLGRVNLASGKIKIPVRASEEAFDAAEANVGTAEPQSPAPPDGVEAESE